MTRNFAKTMAMAGLACLAWTAHAQDNYPDPLPPLWNTVPGPGWAFCIDPTNTAPRSPVYIVWTRANDLFRFTMGGTGTVVYGGPNSPCFTPAKTWNVAGRIGFSSGPQGSVQSTFDDDMDYTFGMPMDPTGSHSTAWTRRRDPVTGVTTSTLLGSALTGNGFAGESARYAYIEQTADNIHTIIHADIVGDGARINFDMTNVGTAAQVGLWYGAEIALLKGDLSDASGFFGATGTYVVLPGRKPLFVDQRFTRASDPANFPPSAQFLFGQTNAYGLEIELGPTPATSNAQNVNSDATAVDEFVVGSGFFIIGDPLGGGDGTNPPDHVFGDAAFAGDDAFLMKYEPISGGTIATNATRTIVSYFRNSWGNAKLVRPPLSSNQGSDQPYSTIVDAPHLLAPDDLGGGTNGLASNPFPVRVDIDNVGGFTSAYKTFSLSDVQVTLSLPPGLSIANGDSATKIISVVHPFELPLPFVEWQVVADGVESGDLPYTVTIRSVPVPTQPIVHTGIIRVAATKQLKLEPSANLVSVPWIFSDSSLDVVLGLTSPADYTAYTWDPVQNSYVVATSATRGQGIWLILNPNTHPTEEVEQLAGATTPPDSATGAPDIQLHAGWNLIGNPYPFSFPVSQLVGVSAANASQSFSFAELVAQNVVSPFLAYWDPAINNYRFVQGLTAQVAPHKGYWMKVLTSQDLTLNFPPIFDTFLPGGRAAEDPGWVQSANHWRLQMNAATNRGKDVENYVGVAVGAQANTLQIPEPPQGPTQDVTLSINGTAGGQPTVLAQSISAQGGTLQWNVSVRSKAGGPTTVTWPNMSTLPHNLSFRLVDSVTHQSVDMRAVNSILFNAAANSTKQFVVQSVNSTASLPTISSLTASAGRLATRTPVTARLTLNYDATVTMTVLNSQGQQVAVLVNGLGRAKGTSTVAWSLQASNGSFVPAGTYQILVKTDDGSQKAVAVAVNR